MKRVRHLRREGVAGREGAAGVSVPDLLLQDMNKAGPVEHSALVEPIGPRKAVDIIASQIRYHFPRRGAHQPSLTQR